MSDIQDLRDKRQGYNAQIEDAKKEISRLNKEILAILLADNVKEHTSDGLTTQVVQKTKQEYDWESIKAKLGLMTWKKIVREVPDPDLLNDQIASGKIKPSDVAKFITTENMGEPYIKVARAKKEVDE